MIFAVVKRNPESNSLEFTGTYYVELTDEIIAHHEGTDTPLVAVASVASITGTPEQTSFGAYVRKVRDMKLAASDWVVVRSSELGELVPEVWKSYRQNLRDITEQAGFPEVVWPSAPQ